MDIINLSTPTIAELDALIVVFERAGMLTCAVDWSNGTRHFYDKEHVRLIVSCPELAAEMLNE